MEELDLKEFITNFLGEENTNYINNNDICCYRSNI